MNDREHDLVDSNQGFDDIAFNTRSVRQDSPEYLREQAEQKNRNFDYLCSLLSNSAWLENAKLRYGKSKNEDGVRTISSQEICNAIRGLEYDLGLRKKQSRR